jgi:hypothetical protein
MPMRSALLRKVFLFLRSLREFIRMRAFDDPPTEESFKILGESETFLALDPTNFEFYGTVRFEKNVYLLYFAHDCLCAGASVGLGKLRRFMSSAAR